MHMTSITIKPFENLGHREQVVELWKAVFGYETAHNSPTLVIDKKIATGDGLFFVAVADVEIVGTIMAGYSSPDSRRLCLIRLLFLRAEP